MYFVFLDKTSGSERFWCGWLGPPADPKLVARMTLTSYRILYNRHRWV